MGTAFSLAVYPLGRGSLWCLDFAASQPGSGQGMIVEGGAIGGLRPEKGLSEHPWHG